MNIIRHQISNSTVKLGDIIELLNNTNTKRIILYATDANPINVKRSDGGDFPLVVALVEYKLASHIETLYILFDGVFLNARRSSRYIEVKQLLDEAIKSQKVFFEQTQVPLTSSLTPEEAVNKLLNTQSFIPLTSNTRPAYFSLLSKFSEDSFEPTP